MHQRWNESMEVYSIPGRELRKLPTDKIFHLYKTHVCPQAECEGLTLSTAWSDLHLLLALVLLHRQLLSYHRGSLQCVCSVYRVNLYYTFLSP